MIEVSGIGSHGNIKPALEIAVTDSCVARSLIGACATLAQSAICTGVRFQRSTIVRQGNVDPRRLTALSQEL